MNINEVLSRLHELRAIPIVVQELMAALGASDVDIDDLARKISRDQALFATVLRVANSSFYGFSRKISSMHEAVLVMGLAGVRSLVLSAGLVHALGRDRRGAHRVEYWQRSFRVASYAKVIAGRLKQSPEAGFAAGLLHNIGQIIAEICLPERYAEVLAKVEADGSDLIATEEEMLGFHHGTLGAEVARRWNFPSEIEHAIRYCHVLTDSNSISKVKQGGDERATKTVHLARLGASEEANAVSPMKWNWNEDASELLTIAISMAVRIDRGDPPEQVLALLPQSVRKVYGLDADWLAVNLPPRDQLEQGIADLLA